ncbi:hypothetical protein [Anaerococcus cruorum]|uniref:Uncharacterized protein n=1 Tax=Anaerococcus cruorum TaxID=3115617 RepID=A0ABW9MW85_9FIRM
MRYYVYGTKKQWKKYGDHPEGYLSEGNPLYKNIIALMKAAEYKYKAYLKIGIINDFKYTLIYEDRKSDEDIEKFELTYIGIIRYFPENEGTLPSLGLEISKDLKADTIQLELTDIECRNLLRCFRDYKIHASKSVYFERVCLGDHRMIDDTLFKIDEVLDDN